MFRLMQSLSRRWLGGAITRSQGIVTRNRLVWIGLSVLVLLFYAPVVLLGRVFCLKDTLLVVYPIRLYLRERLGQFDLPEWLPLLDMGMPFLANPANGVLYPLNFLLLLPAPYCVGLLIVSHAVIAVVGAWFLLRTLSVSALSSAVGAMAFALGGYMVSLTSISSYMMSLGWLPVVATLVLRSLRSRDPRDVAFAGLAWGTLILCGEPQGVVLTGWFVLALAFGYPTRRCSRWRFVAPAISGVLLGVTIALPQILPALELIPRSRRASGIPLAEASHWSLHPLRLLELLVPRFFGSPLEFDRFLGFFMDDEDSLGHRDPWILTPYFGSALLLFALVGVLSARIRHRSWTRPLAILLGFVLLLAIGRHSPFFGLYFNHIPAAKLFRYPAKFFGLAAAILPLLAAAGLDSWRSKPTQRLPYFGTLTLGLMLVLGMCFVPTAAQWLHSARSVVPLGSAKATMTLALSSELVLVVAVAIVLTLARKKPTPLLRYGLCALLTFQVLRITWGAYATAPPSVFAESAFTRTIVATTPTGEPTRLMHDVANLDVEGLDSAPSAVQASAFARSLFKDIGIAQGIGYADAYVSSEEGEKFRFWHDIGRYQRQMLDVFAIRHLSLPASLNLPSESGLKRIGQFTEPTAALYENQTALPFAFGVASVAVVSEIAEAELLLRDPRIAQGLFAVLDGGDVDQRQLAQLARVGTCRTNLPLSDRIDLDCDLSQDGFIVVNESYHPNFSAQLDGVPIPIMRANAFVMSVKANAGRHSLRLVYAESSLLPAATASLIALALSVVLIFRRPVKVRRSVRKAAAA